MPSPCFCPWPSPRSAPQGTVDLPYFHLHASLEAARDPASLSEAHLSGVLSQLQQRCAPESASFWICLARVAEAAILRAARLANSGNFTDCGDLLANPRRIAVRAMGSPHKEYKRRHTPLSDQFAPPHSTICGQRAYFIHNFMVTIETPALLPHLHHLLSTSQYIARRYVHFVESHLERIAEVLNFLACDGIFTPTALDKRLQTLKAAQQHWYISNLCHFDSDTFWRLGQAATTFNTTCVVDDVLIASSGRRAHVSD
ncbi:hypothetical protein [Desulfohalobium retbaense]|uniref:Uncharacterized protein n=1 Tax=Desulfohalobium retbaense (strain ATCC 49708 / DSM 5692 / JCM 16813 / HR100) TaxID=485915 RepID=C8X3U3_DESRD|nr:hypothetical protein [Desulfohalobium retbaense]ACV69090.1 hypothetical protein Dret_1806 [Desulfohalobium retbaense DSM 5692]